MTFAYAVLGLLALLVAANLILGRLPRPPADGGGVIEAAGGPIHYVESIGEGTPIVFIHGMPSTCREFDRVRALLAGRHTIAFDRPGYAWSTGAPQEFAAQLDSLVEAAGALGVERAIVVGHSFGGLAALGMAIRRPEFVERLVLIAPAAGGSRVPEGQQKQARWILRIERFKLRVLLDLLFMRLVRKHAAKLGAASVYGDGPDCAAERHVAESMLARHNSVRAFANDRVIFNDAERLVTRGLGRIVAPVTILQGSEDKTVTTKNAERLRDALKGARYVELEGGHQIPVTDPAAVAHAIE